MKKPEGQDAKTMSMFLEQTGLNKRKVELPITELFSEVYGSRIVERYKFSEGEMVNLCLLALRRLRYDRDVLYVANKRLYQENQSMKEKYDRLL